MTTYRYFLAATVAAALSACGGHDEQAQSQSPAIESTTPAGNAGPPPGAAPASGLGDANSAPTSAAPEPMPVDGSAVAPDGTNAAPAASDGTDASANPGQAQGSGGEAAPATAPVEPTGGH